MFALVDCNNFYASCERVFNPKLQNRPVVILSNNDGCIVARSNEAKALGIPMGAPFFKWKEFIRGHDVAALSSNYALYADISGRIMQILNQFTPELQVYSIDESFLILTGNDLVEQGRRIRETVLQWTGIPVSIGIASTKTLAKVANHKAKKDPNNLGVCYLNDPIPVLDTLPVTEIWGIGARLGQRLNKLGIVTAKDFRDAPDKLIQKHVSIVGLRTAMELRGISCLPLQEIPPAKKSIACTRTFGRWITSLDELNEAVASYTARAAEKARAQHSLATLLTVFIVEHSTERSDIQAYHVRIVLPQPTAYTPHLIHYAKAATEKLFKRGVTYRKAGVILDALVPDHSYQQDLFAKQSSDKQNKLMKAVDHLNQHFGHKVLQTAAEGLKKPWQMARKSCSPSYTTKWEDLLTIKI